MAPYTFEGKRGGAGSLVMTLPAATELIEAKFVGESVDHKHLGLSPESGVDIPSTGYRSFNVHHAQHDNPIGRISGNQNGQHFNIDSISLTPEFLQANGIKPDADYGNWRSSEDVARDHAIAKNLIGPKGVIKLANELTKYGIDTVGSDARSSGGRLKAYGKAPRDRIQTFNITPRKIRKRTEEVATELIERILYHGKLRLDEEKL